MKQKMMPFDEYFNHYSGRRIQVDVCTVEYLVEALSIFDYDAVNFVVKRLALYDERQKMRDTRELVYSLFCNARQIGDSALVTKYRDMLTDCRGGYNAMRV